MAGRDLLVALKINGDGSAAVNALRQVQGGLDKTGDTATKTAREVNVAGEALNSLKNYAAGFASIAGARAVIAYADEFSGLNARLKLSTTSQDEYNAAQSETFAIAQRSRADLSSTVELYGKVQGAFRDLGGSQAEALKVTEAITQTFVISGASAASSAAAITQFAQGLGAGALRGDELNSVLENSPRLAKALADGLGISTGQLRQMGEQGKITGQAIKDALLGQGDKIAAEFAQVQVTTSGALVELSNSATIAFGQIFGDGNTALAGFIEGFAQGLAQFPQTANVAITEVIGFFDVLRIGASEDIQILALDALDSWLSIQEGASILGGKVEIIFAKVAASVASSLKPIADGVVALGGKIGIDTSGIAEFASALGVASNAEAAMTKAVDERTKQIQIARGVLVDQQKDISDTSAIQIAASLAAVQGARDEANAFIAGTAASTAHGTATKNLTVDTKAAAAAARDHAKAIEALNKQFATGQAEINAYQLAQRQSVENGKQYVDGLREENAVLALGKDEREAAIRAIDAERQAREALGITTEADAVFHKNEIAALAKQIEAENNVSAALRRHNEEADRVAENAKRNAEEYTRAWAGGLNRAADAFGQFAASGFKSFSDFRRSIGDIAKNIIAELIATFLKQKIIVPIVAQLAGGIGGSGGGLGGIISSIGSLFGGGGGSGGGLGGIIGSIGSLFGGGGSGGAVAGGGGVGIGGITGIVTSAYSLFTGGAAATAATTAGAAAGATAGVATVGGTVSGALAAIPVAGWIALAALAVNKISGGKLFGTRFETQSTSQNFVFGESGVSGSIVQNQTRQRSFFRGTARNTITSGLDAETQASIAEYFEKASAALRAEADATGGTFAGLIAADFSRQVDKAGKVIKEGGSILGRYYAENADEFQARVLALTRINQLGPEALALSEQFSNGASSVIAGAADFLVGAQAAIKAGVGIAGSSLTEALALTQKLAAPSESLVQTFTRIGQSVDLLRAASAETGIVFVQTGAAFSEFATRLTESAGGVQAANELIGRNINAFFSEEERRVARLAAARTNAGALSEAAGFGVNQVIGASEFREVLNQALAGAFDPAKTAAILRYGAALATVNELAGTSAAALAEQAEKAAAAKAAARQTFNDLISGIAAEARTAPETLSERLAAIRVAELERIKALQDAARAAGADADATRALTQIQRISARETAAAYQALADSTASTFRSLYGDVVQAQEDAFAGGVFNEFVFARLQNRVNLDPERFSQAQGAAANVRQLSENGGGDVFALLDRFSVPLDKFIADLGVNLSAVNSGNAPAQFDQFVFAARTLGIELPELADRFGVAIGRLEDEDSPLNDAFERIIAGLSGSDKTDIEALFKAFENASDAERETARLALIAGIGDLSIAQQALFAPLIDEVDTTTTAEAQVEALGFLVDYAAEQTELLRTIAKQPALPAPETAATATAVATAVAQQTTASAAQSTAEQAVLRDVLAELKLSRQEQTRYAQQLDAVLNRLARGN